MVTTPCSSASSRASPSLSPSLLRSSVFRRRLPIVGAICVLSTLSLSNLFPSLSSPFKTTRAHSISSGRKSNPEAFTRLEWKQLALLCQALWFTSLYLTRKQERSLQQALSKRDLQRVLIECQA
uniref:Uncharacterized protein n=1 Tax=Opuntia streptacantha TaxID=393608 RepID=A0A7C8YDX9_OPUST